MSLPAYCPARLSTIQAKSRLAAKLKTEGHELDDPDFDTNAALDALILGLREIISDTAPATSKVPAADATIASPVLADLSTAPAPRKQRHSSLVDVGAVSTIKRAIRCLRRLLIIFAPAHLNKPVDLAGKAALQLEANPPASPH
jgi:hypothetical protein